MHSLSAVLGWFLLSVALFTCSAVAGAQNSSFSELSHCWRSCLDSSSASSCGDPSLDAYTSCICNLTSQSFLTTVVTCAHSNCPSSDVTTHLPLEALQFACTAIGKPIDSSALAAAQSARSSAAVWSGYGYATSSDGGVYGATTMTATADVGTATAITLDGSSASAASGEQSTGDAWTGTAATPVSSSSPPTSSSLSPSSSLVVGDGASSIPTSAVLSTSTAAILSSEPGTTSSPAAGSTLTTSSSQTTTHSSSAGADSAVKTEGAPLGMQGTGSRKDAGSVLGLTVWLIAGIVWF